jgi:hypothetical protein
LAMPVMNGLMAAQEITKVLPTVPIVLYTLYSSTQVELEAKKHGIRKVVEKTHSGALVSAIQELVDKGIPRADATPQAVEMPLAAVASPAAQAAITSLSAQAIAAEVTPGSTAPARDNVIKRDWTNPNPCHFGGLKSYDAFPWFGSPTLSGSAGSKNESGANYGHGKEAYKVR